MSEFLRSMAQFTLISVGLGFLITFNDNFLPRTIGLIMLLAALDWRYKND